MNEAELEAVSKLSGLAAKMKAYKAKWPSFGVDDAVATLERCVSLIENGTTDVRKEVPVRAGVDEGAGDAETVFLKYDRFQGFVVRYNVFKADALKRLSSLEDAVSAFARGRRRRPAEDGRTRSPGDIRAEARIERAAAAPATRRRIGDPRLAGLPANRKNCFYQKVHNLVKKGMSREDARLAALEWLGNEKHDDA